MIRLISLSRKAGPHFQFIDKFYFTFFMIFDSYLFLATERGVPILKENSERVLSLGAKIAVMNPQELSRRFPFLNVEDIAMGSLGLQGEGWCVLKLLCQAVANSGLLSAFAGGNDTSTYFLSGLMLMDSLWPSSARQPLSASATYTTRWSRSTTRAVYTMERQ